MKDSDFLELRNIIDTLKSKYNCFGIIFKQDNFEEIKEKIIECYGEDNKSDIFSLSGVNLKGIK